VAHAAAAAVSLETRQRLVDDPRLVLAHHSQRADLLDPELTNTWLVEFLLRLLDAQDHPLLITAVRTDHTPGTYHNPPGRGVDLWHADWASVGDERIVDVMHAAGIVAASGEPTLVEVGLSGTAAYYITYVTWPAGCDVFIESYGDDNEHLHFAVGTPHG
jgi:hypothetical protein